MFSLYHCSPASSKRYLRVKAEIVIWCLPEAMDNLRDRLRKESSEQQGIFDFDHMKIYRLGV